MTKSNFPSPRRTTSGFDFNRANLLLAVIEKRGGYYLGSLDVYLNIVGGLRLDDTACDLAVVLAVISSLLDSRFQTTQSQSERLVSAAKCGMSAIWMRV